MIERLGRLAFEQTAAQTREWLRTLPVPEEFFVSVNLSPSQLQTEALLTDMRSLVQQDRQVASHLKLEITEGQVMANPEHSAYMLSALKAMGLTNLRIVGMILLQALVVGSIGYGLGVGLAALFGKLTTSADRLAFFMPWQVLLVTGVAVMLITVLSSLLSIRRVLVLEPAIVFR